MKHISQVLSKTHIPQTNLKPALGDTSMVEYECFLCQDAYWLHPNVDGKVDYSQLIRCKCRAEQDKAEKWAKLLRYCQLPAGSERQTLDTFIAKGNKSLQEAKQAASDISEGKGDIKWLTLIGKTDTGKSHLAKAIAR